MVREKEKENKKDKLTLKYLIDNELFICCSLQKVTEFVRFCKDRNVRVDVKQLEKFDELGVFKPIARVEYPKVTSDCSKSDSEYNRILQFWFEKECALEAYQKGWLWDPWLQPYKPWNLFDHEVDERQAECYYSPFQIYGLNWLLNQTGWTLRAEWWVSYSEEEIQNRIKQIKHWANNTISAFQKGPDKAQRLAYVCQVISNRYYPKTQTDRRTIWVPLTFRFKKWDWGKYCQNWRSNEVLQDIDFTIEELKKLQQHLVINAQHADPLQRWYGLVSFISLEKKKKLKGNALYAQTLYSMSEMLRFFIEDLTGEELPEPDESRLWRKESFYGEGVKQNEYEYLEFLTNQFKLNSKPKLILVVEGHGEEREFPRLANELLGCSFSRVGIDVVNIRGIGGFTGHKRSDKLGALEKFIDDHHRRQTIVFMILDNEGRASKIKEKLITSRSKFHPHRTITKDEYIRLWDKNIEFDNFSDDEIARAMTKLADARVVFENQEIALCRQDRLDGESNPLGKLYKHKVADYELDKPKLLEVLFGDIISKQKNEFDKNDQPKRKIVELMTRVIELALSNHQPVTKDVKEKNQESDLLGDPLS